MMYGVKTGLVILALLALLGGCASVPTLPEGATEQGLLFCPQGPLAVEGYDLNSNPQDGSEYHRYLDSEGKIVGEFWFGEGQGGELVRAKVRGREYSPKEFTHKFQSPCDFLIEEPSA